MPRASNRDAVGAQHGRIELHLVLAPPATATQAHPVAPGDATAVQPRDFRRSCAAAGPNPDPDPTPVDAGARGRTTRVNLSELNMQYGHVRAISRSVGAITVRSSGIQPCGDVVVLARTATGWQRINLENGSVTFCRRTRRGKRRRALRDRRQHDRHASHTGPQQRQRTDHVPLTPLRDADGNAGRDPAGRCGGRRAAADHRFHSASTRLRDVVRTRAAAGFAPATSRVNREEDGRDHGISSSRAPTRSSPQTSRPRQRTAPSSLRDRSRRATVDVPGS